MSSKIAGFILAAGEGRRLRPLTLSRPKAMIPVCGVPMIELAATQLAAAPVASLIVNTWYLPQTVEEFAGPLARRLGLPLRLSREPKLLDTGGGLRRGAALAPDAAHILVHNSDVILDCDLRALIEFHLAREAAVTAFLVPGAGPRTAAMKDDGRITDFSLPPGKGLYTFSGVHILRRDVLDLLPEVEVCSIVHAYERAVAAGLPVFGLSTGDAYWSDLGRPTDYIKAHGDVADLGIRHIPLLREAQAEQARRRADMERSGVRCTGAIGLGRNLTVPAGGHLHNVILWDDTVLDQPWLYADSVFTGERIPLRPVDEHRRPDPRIWFCLDVQPDTAHIEPLPKLGSNRRYCRISAGTQNWIWCAYNHQRRENATFAALADFLEDLGLNIPRVHVHLGDAGEIVSRDLGGQSLQGIADAAETERLLKDVIRQIARLHVLGEPAARLQELPLQNGFTKGLYDWERDYFREYILSRLLNRPERWSPAAAEYRALRTQLLEEPPAPIHRDLQSANIMVVDGQPYLIDFQGMRLGCAAYDLGALLFDPYREHPHKRRERLWEFYQEQVRNLGGEPPSYRIFYAASVQRLFQALGAYGKLWIDDGLPWYRQFIPAGLELLRQAAESGGWKEIAALATDAAAVKM